MNEIRIPGALLLALLVFCAVPVSATTLTLLPDHATMAPGALLNVGIVLTGPAGGPAPSTGDFDFAVTYDPAVLKATAVSFGAALGDETAGEVIETFDLSNAGRLEVAAVSLLPSVDLEALQPESYTLATLTFLALSAGTSELSLVISSFDDAAGINQLADIQNTTIVAVPVPCVAMPFVFALCALARSTGRRQQGRAT